jgi:hypothetical protein
MKGIDYLEKAKHYENVNALPAVTTALALIAIAEELRALRVLLEKLSTDEVGKVDEYL